MYCPWRVLGTSLRASPRAGKSLSELAEISDRLKRQPGQANVALSQSARKRVKIDSLLEGLGQPDTELPRLFGWVEQRAHQRELRYREEREAGG